LQPPAAAPSETKKPLPAESTSVPAQTPALSPTPSQVTTLSGPADSAEVSATPQEEDTTAHQAAKSNKPGTVRSVNVSRAKDAIEVHIEGSKPLRASASRLSNPERIIIDLVDVRVHSPRRIPVKAGDVEAINMSLYLVNPLVTRVVVDLAHPHPYRLWGSGNWLILRIENNDVKAAGSPPAH
jgi:AMIN domain